MTGIRIPGGQSTTHYLPLHRSDSQYTVQYVPDKLPLRTHDEFLKSARAVQAALTKAAAERLSKECGIKGIPALSHLSSLDFPHSFPYDFMHLIWENLMKNLILLWTGTFKGLDAGNGSYVIDSTVWDAIGKATASSGQHIPSCFGARPPNFVSDQSACTADTWSFWTLYLGPVLLRDRFAHQKYYTHFVALVKLLHRCLQFTLNLQEVAEIRQGFIQWVLDYEE